MKILEKCSKKNLKIESTFPAVSMMSNETNWPSINRWCRYVASAKQRAWFYTQRVLLLQKVRRIQMFMLVQVINTRSGRVSRRPKRFIHELWTLFKIMGAWLCLPVDFLWTLIYSVSVWWVCDVFGEVSASWILIKCNFGSRENKSALLRKSLWMFGPVQCWCHMIPVWIACTACLYCIVFLEDWVSDFQLTSVRRGERNSGLVRDKKSRLIKRKPPCFVCFCFSSLTNFFPRPDYLSTCSTLFNKFCCH